MKPIKHGLPALGAITLLQLALNQAWADPLALSQTPLFLSSANKANVLMMYGNSNSMDSDATGHAVGSAKPTSKSEIARRAMMSVIDNYTGYINMGLLAYQQNAMSAWWIHSNQYDVSYNSAHYDPGFTGARNKQTKKFAINNPTSAGEKIYYNVNLPFYAPSSYGNSFCHTPTACTSPDHDFRGRAGNCSVPEHETTGPWDRDYCYPTKTGQSNAAPGEPGAGYSGQVSESVTFPSDSDLGQGITDFGRLSAMQVQGRTWFNNTAPGKGYLHLPVAMLDEAHAAKLKKKLATSQFTNNKPTDPAQPLQNAGLSPLAGTVMTANDYFAGSLSAPAQGGPATAPPNSCQKNFLVTLTDGLPSVGPDGVASANVAANLTGLTTAVSALRASNAKAETYVVGFALPYGVSITQLDAIAAAGGSQGAYYADDPATLNAAFGKIFASIMAKTSAASAVALNSQAVALGAHVFQARFSSGDWSGELFKLGFHDVQENSVTVRRLNQDAPVWSAGAQLKAHAPDSRVILTTNPVQRAGVKFRWPVDAARPTGNELAAAQVKALSLDASGLPDEHGSARLDYLRGASVNEGDQGLKWRRRPLTPLGDIVNSAPHYVGVPDANYGLAGYGEYRALRKNRLKMIYVGANDGMLHGFDMDSGVERLAYVPSNLFPKLSALSGRTYAHRYYVDGSPNANDVEFGAGNWRTMLVSGLGAGGRGIFGLDVTDPTQFAEVNAANVVKFELTEKDNDAVGNISGPVAIVKLNNGKWAAVFGNGYNSGGNGGSGEAVLFVIDIQSGAVIAQLKAGVDLKNVANGLSEALVIDKDSNYTADLAYAGDLQGNLWKFDLSHKNPQQWSVSKLFKAPQPITSAPDAGEHPKGGYLVFFGTGKYLESGDVGSAPGNAMYGVWDDGSGEVNASLLVTQQLSKIADINGVAYRVASTNAVNYTSKRGWTIPFPTAAERAVSAPQLRDGRVVSVSLIPSGVECTPGGDSWLNEVDWLSGGQLARPVLDTNGDNKINSLDTMVSGRAIAGVVSPPAIQSASSSLENNLVNKSDGKLGEVLGAASPKRARRLSWRQIK